MEKIALTCLGKIAECLAAPVGRQLGYLFCFDANVKTLEDEVEKLRGVKEGIQMRVDEATRNVEVILTDVEKWLEAVNTIDVEAQNISQEKADFPKGCFSRWCLKFKSRNALSRNAKKKTQFIVELQKRGEAFQSVACPAPLIPLIVPPPSTISFVSRKSMLNDIIKSLKNEEISMIGICGMGGVGKTTMMLEVAKKVREESPFHDIAETVVSQNIDPIKIQSDIAEHMGLKLTECSIQGRAGRINARLQGKKVLIILDDVWEEFDLQPLGIDLKGNKWCKIVYTSRHKNLWMEFGSRRCELPLNVLPYDEALGLFKEKVGDLLHKQSELLPIAEEIVKECGGLPLCLVTLGSALRTRTKHSWNDTLSKLRTASGFDGKVYECLKRSYDYLDSEEAKSLLLLCSMFEEDSKIYVERLVRMGMGLRLFNRVSSVEAARDRVFDLLQHLHSCYLVSNPEATYVEVHDVIRDVSKSIASMEKYALVFEDGDKLEGLQEGKFENSRWISIISKDIKELPNWLNCPRLELLMCRHEELLFPDSCFERMEKLQVVDINCNITPQFPSSLKFLKIIRFKNYNWEDLTAIGNLASLEILHLSGTSIVVPKEIGQLTELIVLDLSDCRLVTRISRGVISSLTKLEELYLPDVVLWEGEGNAYPSLRELEALSNLRTLYITVMAPTVVPTTRLIGNLEKYRIIIGDSWVNSFYFEGCEKVLALDLSIDIPLKREFQFLLYNSDGVGLRGPFAKDMALEFLRKGSEKIVKFLIIEDIGQGDAMLYNTYVPVATPLLCTLERLRLWNVQDIQHICIRPLVAGVLEKLKKLSIGRCNALENILQLSSSSTADVEIVERNSGGDTLGEVTAANKLNCSQLQELWIENLPKVVSFCKGIEEIQFPQLTYLNFRILKGVECLISSSSSDQFSNPDENSVISFFPHKVSFPGLVNMELYALENMKKIWCGQLQAGSFRNLAELGVFRCNNLQYVFSPWMARYLVHLRTLKIEHCECLKEVVRAEKEGGGLEEYTSSILPELKKIRLANLPAIESFCHIPHDLEFPMLNDVEIRNCPELKTFTPGFVRTPNLNGSIQHLYENVSFPSLVNMKLCALENMKEICRGQLLAGFFRNLAELSVWRCNSLHYVFSPWMARYLVHLRTLKIEHCKSLKDVVRAEKEGDGQEECTSSILPELKKILLVGLPAIESFCHISHDLDFPVLKHVRIRRCPELRTFAPGFVRTPNLNCVFYKKDEMPWKGNLNGTIQHLYENQQEQSRQRQEDGSEENEDDSVKEDVIMDS